MRAPTVCNNCGTIFPSGFEMRNSTNITFSGCESGPCPNCGGNGHIPDGVYNFVGNTIELLSGPSRTKSELERLATLLRVARQEESTFEEVSKQITKEIPELSSLQNFLPKSRTELYAFTSIILTIVGLLLGNLHRDTSPKIEVNQVINNIYNQQAGAPSKTPVIRPKKKKMGRNDRCPCGSGMKYKKCCIYKKKG